MADVNDVAAMIISPFLLFGPPYSTNLESRVQESRAVHAQVSHYEFFRQEIAGRVQDLLRRKVPFNSGEYDEIIEKIIQDYGLPFKKEDIVNSRNFRVDYYLVDRLFIRCEVKGRDGATISAIWVYPDRAFVAGTDRDSDSPLVLPPYVPKHANP